MSFELIAQQAIFGKLNGAIAGVTIYDDVPMLPIGQPLANFPYVVIGNDTFLPWDNDDRTGAEMTITLHIWSRAAGMKEAKTIAGSFAG